MIEAGDTWPTKSWSSQRGTARARSTAQAAVGAQVAGEGARVDARDRGDRRVAQECRELARVAEDRRRGVRDDEGPEPRPERLVVVDQATVVTDQRIRHHDDLAGV